MSNPVTTGDYCGHGQVRIFLEFLMEFLKMRSLSLLLSFYCACCQSRRMSATHTIPTMLVLVLFTALCEARALALMVYVIRVLRL